MKLKEIENENEKTVKLFKRDINRITTYIFRQR
jgi:hypothetical protein